MSLATTSGAGAAGAMGGGLVMAHQAGPGTAPPPPPQVEGMGGAPIFMGADLTDKSQGLSMKQVKNASHLPLVAVDLHAAEPHLAYFPPKPADPSQGATPVLVGKMKSSLYFKANSETAHKTLKKYLALSKSFRSLQTDSLTKSTDASAVVLAKPQLWLGYRRTGQAPAWLTSEASSTGKSHAIDQEVPQGIGAAIVNSTLDGSEPTGDDFDRVVWKIRLSDSKKALAVLPEEAVQALVRQAQYHVAAKALSDNNDDDDSILDCPVAVALPAWAFHDAAVEALLEAAAGAVIVSRSVAALAGALLPPTKNASTLLTRLAQVRKNSQQEFQKVLAQNPDALWEDEVLLILVGMTEEGLETTAIQVSSENNQNNQCALFGDYKVLSNVSYQHTDPVSQLARCAAELEQQVDKIAPEADGPAGIVFYGSAAEQDKLKAAWEAQRKQNAKSSEWTPVPLYTTKPDAVALGTAVLGGVSHGRSTRIRKIQNKSKPTMALQVQNVAPMAVGVRLSYHGTPKDWTAVPTKTIFDFDRRVPAGPYALDFVAAECAVYRQHSSAPNETTTTLSDEAFLKAVKDKEGTKGIPQREEAALDLRVQIVQKHSRDGEWKPVGDVMQPLVKVVERDDDGKDTKVEAVESVTLELSLGVNGMITNALVGERQSVVQATKSAYQSAMRYYIGLAAAILFFGGFMIRSYYEEYAFKRDVRRLLAYYEHVIPGSLSDGDENNARYVVWKYRNKKEKLWRMLEKKYGEKALYADEWPERDDDDAKEGTEEETVDLDENDSDEGEAAADEL